MNTILLTKNHDSFTNPTLQSFLVKYGYKFKHQKIKFLLPRTEQNYQEDKFIDYIFFSGRFYSPTPIFQIFALFFNKDKTLILVDPLTLPYAIIAKLLGYKIIYFSFEIFFQDEEVQNKSFFKKNFINFRYQQYSFIFKLIDLILIQDETRKTLLKKEHKISEHTKFILCPVAPSSELLPTQNKKNNTLSVLYSGLLCNWALTDSIIGAIEDPQWPRELGLQLHSKQANISNTYKMHVLKLQKNGFNIHIDTKPIFSYSSYLEYIKNFSIGISIYIPTFDNQYNGKNIQYIGLSSGKTNCYLSQGLPVISTQNEELSKLNSKRCLEFINPTSATIAAAVRKIYENLDLYRQNSSYMFKNHLTPDTALDLLLKELE